MRLRIFLTFSSEFFHNSNFSKSFNKLRFFVLNKHTDIQTIIYLCLNSLLRIISKIAVITKLREIHSYLSLSIHIKLRNTHHINKISTISLSKNPLCFFLNINIHPLLIKLLLIILRNWNSLIQNYNTNIIPLNSLKFFYLSLSYDLCNIHPILFEEFFCHFFLLSMYLESP